MSITEASKTSALVLISTLQKDVSVRIVEDLGSKQN
uniref:Uncharacterized protein n=1 Tax=Anguilla anguilla TaxID=7936 RepID=A0A0E9V1H8_ANGAN